MKTLALIIGGILILVYLLFLGDERLTNGEQRVHYILTGLLTGFPHFATRGNKGKPWGIWILLIGTGLVIFGLWPE